VSEGHRRGANVVFRVINDALEWGIPILTFYLFSTENWRRRKEEVNFLMQLGEWWFRNHLEELNRKDVCVKVIGRVDELSPRFRSLIEESMRLTQKNQKLLLNLAINYGGRKEILDAVNALLRENLKPPIEEETFTRYLYTAGIPDPDLLIRTSGEMRVSNFLLWQIAYAEIYVTPVYWPDFTREEFKKALEEYARRERRWGK